MNDTITLQQKHSGAMLLGVLLPDWSSDQHQAKDSIMKLSFFVTMSAFALLCASPIAHAFPIDETNTRSVDIKVREYCTADRTAAMQITATEILDRTHDMTIEVKSVGYFDYVSPGPETITTATPVVIDIISTNTNRPDSLVTIDLTDNNGLHEVWEFETDRFLCNKREIIDFSDVELSADETCTAGDTAAIDLHADGHEDVYLEVQANRRYPGFGPAPTYPTIDEELDSTRTVRPLGFITTYLRTMKDGAFDGGGLEKITFKRDRLNCNKD